ncbi:MAG: hypothetical protein II936_09225 [Oscillospiraceae bacterium]|nr:hypothetical protein [Oscillospiraceae bacterium]
MNRKTILAAMAAALVMFTACRSVSEPKETTVTTTEEITTEITTTDPLDDPNFDPFLDETYTAPTLYMGKEVENEEDLAIFKFRSDIPEGFEVIENGAEGIYYGNDKASIIIKAQNFKEEFSDLHQFADNGLANIVYSNMLYQSDTTYDDPIDTKVAGFDAVRYNYHITAYIFEYETDTAGEVVTDTEGKPHTIGKNIYQELENRVYFFYSDEDVFYIICETPKEYKDEMAPVFDQFIESVSIAPKE